MSSDTSQFVTKGMIKGLVWLIVIGMFVQLAVVGFVFEQSYQGRVDLVASQRKGCARGKLDRQDNADFQRAQATYITKVTHAKSVQEDVKAAAREAVRTFNRTSKSLAERAQIDCTEAFPKASWHP